MRILIFGALLLAALAMRDTASARLGRLADRDARPPVTAAAPRLVTTPAPAPVEPTIVDPLTTLPPEDIEWVLDHVERTESVRELDEAQRARLIAQLVSVRMHDVIERTEPYVAEVEP